MHPGIKWLVIGLGVFAVLFAAGFAITAMGSGDGVRMEWWWVVPAGALALIAFFGLRFFSQNKIESHDGDDDPNNDHDVPETRP